MIGDSLIRAAINQGDIKITPFEDRLLGPASYDIRLGDSLRGMPDMVIDPMRPPQGHEYETVTLPSTIPPNRVYLGNTLETIRVGKGFIAQVEGKSSLGRLGLAVHVTAGYVDPGFHGQLTLELVNLSGQPMYLESGMQIGQVTFARIEGVSAGYAGKGRYQGQSGPQPSKGVSA